MAMGYKARTTLHDESIYSSNTKACDMYHRPILIPVGSYIWSYTPISIQIKTLIHILIKENISILYFDCDNQRNNLNLLMIEEVYSIVSKVIQETWDSFIQEFFA